MSAGVAPTDSKHFLRFSKATSTCSANVGGVVPDLASIPIWPAMVIKVLVEEMGVVCTCVYVGRGAWTKGGLISWDLEDIVRNVIEEYTEYQRDIKRRRETIEQNFIQDPF